MNLFPPQQKALQAGPWAHHCSAPSLPSVPGPNKGRSFGLFCNQDRLQYYDQTKRIYHAESGVVYGSTLIQSDYAKSLALIAKYGPDAFYQDGEYAEGPSIAHRIADDMAVAVTTSLEARFGSAVVAQGTGFLLNRELHDFNMDAPGTAQFCDTAQRGEAATEPGGASVLAS